MGKAENLNKILSGLPGHIKLVAVSKTKPVEDIQEVYDAGQRIFGENRALELAEKYGQLPQDIEWHMIGHLQTNKVKYIAPFVSLIHGVDSFKLLKVINKEAQKNNRVINCLVQFHIATEDSKYGFDMEEVKAMMSSPEYNELKSINIVGVMGMATFTHDMDVVRKEFIQLKKSFDQLKSEYFSKKEDFTEVSMGMSDDHKVAIEEGSTMVRIGSSIFGARY